MTHENDQMLMDLIARRDKQIGEAIIVWIFDNHEHSEEYDYPHVNSIKLEKFIRGVLG